jgi:hypothetical protein
VTIPSLPLPHSSSSLSDSDKWYGVPPLDDETASNSIQKLMVLSFPSPHPPSSPCPSPPSPSPHLPFASLPSKLLLFIFIFIFIVIFIVIFLQKHASKKDVPQSYKQNLEDTMILQHLVALKIAFERADTDKSGGLDMDEV